MSSFSFITKNWIALGALIISIISFIFAYYNWRDQNNKWDALNEARIDLADIYFFAWELIAVNEANSIKWGWKPKLFTVVENQTSTGNLKLLDKLVIIDKNRDKIEGSGRYRTVTEAVKSAQDLGLDSNEYILQKQQRLWIKVKNVGQTNANDIHIMLQTFDEETKSWIETFNTTSSIELVAGAERSFKVDFFISIDDFYPDPMKFKLNLNYSTINDRKISKELPLAYKPHDNLWAL